MERVAQSVEGQPEESWEPLSHHLTAVGRRAAGSAERFGASTLALIMGLLHDIGKAAMPYQLYIRRPAGGPKGPDHSSAGAQERSEEHTSELQSLMRISYAVFCLKKTKTTHKNK